MRLHFPNWLPQMLACLERTEHHFDVQHTNIALPIPTRTRLSLASHTTLSHRHLLSPSLMWTKSPAPVPKPQDHLRPVRTTRTSTHLSALAARILWFWVAVTCPRMNVVVVGSGACVVATCSMVNVSMS